MDSLHLDLSYVSFKIFYVMNPVKLILTNMTLHVLFYLDSGDAFFVTQKTMLRIYPSLTIYVSHWVVPGDEFLPHRVQRYG